MESRLTVFTPTYNRADKLKRAYDSLKRQTNKGFVWLIVDDGSTDDTPNVVKGFISDNIVDIKYLKQSNGGKMRAHNRGVIECDTGLFVCLDSDDYLSDNAVSDILEAWQTIGDDKRYAGIIAYKGETHNPDKNRPDNTDDAVRPIYGNYFPDVSDCSFKELYRKGFKGETTLVFRTELLKAHLFPEIDGEKYVPEDVVYDRLDEGHIFKVMPKILTICELVDEGYTDRVAELRREAPTGWLIYYYQRAVSEPMSLLKLKYASHYLRFRGKADRKYKEEYNLPAGLKLMGFPGYIALTAIGKL